MRPNLESLPDEILYIPQFVCLVGSSVAGEGRDIDILIRGDAIKDEGMIPLLRRAFGGRDLHYIFNPAGAHDDYIPIYDLFLRKREIKIRHPLESRSIFKGSTFLPDEVIGGDLKVDLGCGENKPEGYLGIDTVAYPGVDLLLDLSTETLPFPDSSVSEFRAHHLLEHLRADAAIRLIEEAWRCLKPGKIFDIEIPSTDGRGAFMPAHRSYWNADSFIYFERDELRRQIHFAGRYRIADAQDRRIGGAVYTRVIMEAMK